jgi:hypothetical protein
MNEPRPRRKVVAIEYEMPDGSTFILAAPSHSALRRAAKAARLPEPDERNIGEATITQRISRLTEPQN